VYRFLFRPAWLLSHFAVLLLVVTLISLGLWQLRRLDEKQTLNATIESRAEESAVDVTGLIAATAEFGEGDDIEFRAVTATGVYQPDDEVLIHNRTLDGAPGRWVLTPLLLEDGTAVVVNRGWIPFSMMPGDPRPDADPPAGGVTVVGVARPTTTRSGIQTADPSAGRLQALSRPDLGRYQQQLDYDIYPILVQLSEQTPAQATDLPVPLPSPDLSEGPHLGYAMQWFIFTIIALVGYPLVLRRVAAGKAKPAEATETTATVPP
jgi:surfeit locus 1 family protein